MSAHELVTPALEPTVAVVKAVRPDQLDLPTPCGNFTVRQLLDHMAGTATWLSTAGGAQGDPPESLEERYALLNTIYSDPKAWEGEISMGSAPMPAPMVGGMAIGEVVVHGWDLATATGQHPQWAPEVLAFLLEDVAKTAELGRQMEAYGKEVFVPADAPPLDRILGLTGRNPQWTAA